MPLIAKLWIWYPLTAAALVLWGGLATSDPALRLGRFVLLHLGLALLAALLGRCCPGSRVVWSAFTAIGLPAVFSAVGWVLPMVHPEPYEWCWIAWDRWLVGDDPIPMLHRTLWPLFTEVLHVCYVGFYLVPVAALLGIAARRDGRNFDAALVAVAFGFQTSYLGYLLWPTLGPNRLGLWEQPYEGLALTEPVRAFIAVAEANHWDCFPSGHTMLSLLSLWLAWRHARGVFWALLPCVLLIVYATVALCYHYVSDVLAGAGGCGLALLGARWLQRCTPVASRIVPPAASV